MIFKCTVCTNDQPRTRPPPQSHQRLNQKVRKTNFVFCCVLKYRQSVGLMSRQTRQCRHCRQCRQTRHGRAREHGQVCGMLAASCMCALCGVATLRTTVGHCTQVWFQRCLFLRLYRPRHAKLTCDLNFIFRKEVTNLGPPQNRHVVLF